jgi:hypothetical protein
MARPVGPVRRPRASAAWVAMVAALALTGCTDSGSGDGDRHSPSPSSDANAFSACMRERGIPMEDGDSSRGGERASVPDGVDPDVFQRAVAACGQQGGSEAQPAQEVAAGPEVSRCMRDEGITDYPDPVDGQVDYDPGDPPPPAFLDAMATCWKKVHGLEMAR